MLALQAKEEVEALEKKMVQLENELATTTTNLENSNKRLEEREKALQNVSHTIKTSVLHDAYCLIAWGDFLRRPTERFDTHVVPVSLTGPSYIPCVC